jgi:hypothetical protein
MSKFLSKELIISIIKEQWQKRINEAEKIDVFGTISKDGKKNLLSPGLRVTHKESGIKYDIEAVGNASVVLSTPEGKQFKVDNETLQKEYEI